MKQWLIIIFIFSMPLSSYAKIVGVSSKIQLLQQLSLSLNVPVADMNIPSSLIDKLPNTTQIEEVTTTFLTAWTQITYIGCSKAMSNGKMNLTLNESTAKKWITQLSESTWGAAPLAEDVNLIFQSTLANKVNDKQAHVLACSMILSSPKSFLKTNL